MSLTLTHSHAFAEEYLLSQLSFKHKKSLRVAAAQRFSFRLTDVKMPPLGHLPRNAIGCGATYDQPLVIETFGINQVARNSAA